MKGVGAASPANLHYFIRTKSYQFRILNSAFRSLFLIRFAIAKSLQMTDNAVFQLELQCYDSREPMEQQKILSSKKYYRYWKTPVYGGSRYSALDTQEMKQYLRKIWSILCI